jgi:hypothetical protein
MVKRVISNKRAPLAESQSKRSGKSDCKFIARLPATTLKCLKVSTESQVNITNASTAVDLNQTCLFCCVIVLLCLLSYYYLHFKVYYEV